MIGIYFLLGVDPFLGKVNKSSFSHQTLMELFIDTIENTEAICGSGEEPNERIEEWAGVKFDDRGDLMLIKWSWKALGGTIDLQWLPTTLKKAFLNSTKLSGQIDLTSLPKEMTILNLSVNRFSGEIYLKSLPEKMEDLNVSSNHLSGTIDLESLPQLMVTLRLSYNNFTGGVSFGGLPNGIQRLFLQKNGFSGETDFSQLPPSLFTFDVSLTQLEGVIHLDGTEEKFFFAKNSHVKIHRGK